jgi:hypothetical protein
MEAPSNLHDARLHQGGTAAISAWPKKDIPFLMAANPSTSRVLPLLAAMSLLAGCFQSEQPKFPLAEAAAPFGEGGRYVVYEWVAGDRFERQEVFVITRRADRGYDFVNEKGETLTMSLHALGGDRFVGQASPDKTQPGYGYVVFRMTGNEALLYLPQCDKQDKAVLSAAGVELNGQYECMVDRVGDPAGLFRRLDLGEPASKLVRE